MKICIYKYSYALYMNIASPYINRNTNPKLLDFFMIINALYIYISRKDKKFCINTLEIPQRRHFQHRNPNIGQKHHSLFDLQFQIAWEKF